MWSIFDQSGSARISHRLPDNYSQGYPQLVWITYTDDLYARNRQLRRWICRVIGTGCTTLQYRIAAVPVQRFQRGRGNKFEVTAIAELQHDKTGVAITPGTAGDHSGYGLSDYVLVVVDHGSLLEIDELIRTRAILRS